MLNRGTACDVAYRSGEAEQPSPPDPTHETTASDRAQLESQLPYATYRDANSTEPTQKMPLVNVHRKDKDITPPIATKHTIFAGFEHAFNGSRLTDQTVSENVAGSEAVAGGEDMRGSPVNDPPPKRRKMGLSLAPHPVGPNRSSPILRSARQQRTQIDPSELDEDEMSTSGHVFSAPRPTSPTDADSASRSSARNSGKDWDAEEYAAWLVRNDIQRCEAFIFTLQAVVEGCKKRGRTDTLELLATELEKVIDRLNRPN